MNGSTDRKYQDGNPQLALPQGDVACVCDGRAHTPHRMQMKFQMTVGFPHGPRSRHTANAVYRALRVSKRVMVVNMAPQPGISTEAEPRWFLFITAGGQDKSAATHLAMLGIQIFFPLQAITRDLCGLLTYTVPVFPDRVFARFIPTPATMALVRAIPGVCSLFGDPEPIAIPDVDISMIQKILALGCPAQPGPLPEAGRHVRLGAGDGIEGVLLETRGSSVRAAFPLDAMRQSLIVEAPARLVRAGGPVDGASHPEKDAMLV
jgi:hypothetical protein